MGVALRPVSAEEAAGRTPRGMLVIGATRGSVASRADIRPDALVVKFDDHDVNSVEGLWRPMSQKHPGDAASLTIVRNGVEISVAVQF